MNSAYLGVSGKNMIKHMTIPGRMHWTTVGSLHAHDESSIWRLVPYVVQPAKMLPSHQKLLIQSQHCLEEL